MLARLTNKENDLLDCSRTNLHLADITAEYIYILKYLPHEVWIKWRSVSMLCSFMCSVLFSFANAAHQGTSFLFE